MFGDFKKKTNLVFFLLSCVATSLTATENIKFVKLGICFHLKKV